MNNLIKIKSLNLRTIELNQIWQSLFGLIVVICQHNLVMRVLLFSLKHIVSEDSRPISISITIQRYLNVSKNIILKST